MMLLDIINATDLNDTIVVISKFISALAIIGGAGAGIMKFIKVQVKKMATEDIKNTVKEEVNKYTSEFTKSLNAIESSITALQDTLNGYIAVNEKQTEDIIKSMCDTVREKIWRIHRDCMKADYISDHEWYIVNELWDDYNNRLGGNSFVGELVSDLRELYFRCHHKNNEQE